MIAYLASKTFDGVYDTTEINVENIPVSLPSFN